MGALDEIELWTAAKAEYIFRFFHLRTGETAEVVIPHARLAPEERKKFLADRLWLDNDAKWHEPDVRLAIESNGRRRVVTDQSLVECYLKLGEKPFLRKHNETEFAKLLANKRLLVEQRDRDIRHVIKEEINAMLKSFAERESAFAEWFAQNDFEVPSEEKPAHPSAL